MKQINSFFKSIYNNIKNAQTLKAFNVLEKILIFEKEKYVDNVNIKPSVKRFFLKRYNKAVKMINSKKKMFYLF